MLRQCRRDWNTGAYYREYLPSQLRLCVCAVVRIESSFSWSGPRSTLIIL